MAKFVCAILVFCIHISPFGYEEPQGFMWYISYGVMNYLTRIAVPFFFVCSGYFLYRKTSFEEFSIAPTRNYVLRLFRLYLIWTLLYFPLAYRTFALDEKGMLHAVLTYIWKLIVCTGYRHLWYLNATIFAVLLISFLLSRKVKPRKMIMAAFILYVIGLFDATWFGFIKPLSELAPTVWAILRVLKRIIFTTRNGLFEGFLFVGIGMLFAFERRPLPKRTSLIGFVVFMLLLLIEVFSLEHFHILRGNDMYLFLVPAVFFGFSFLIQIQLKDRKIYRTLRTMSMLIYFTHVWSEAIVSRILRDGPYAQTHLVFILAFVLTMSGSWIYMKLSEYPKFKWMKKLYT